MANFLSRLADRTLGEAPVVGPVIAPMFASASHLTGMETPNLARVREQEQEQEQIQEPPVVTMEQKRIHVPLVVRDSQKITGVSFPDKQESGKFITTTLEAHRSRDSEKTINGIDSHLRGDDDTGAEDSLNTETSRPFTPTTSVPAKHPSTGSSSEEKMASDSPFQRNAESGETNKKTALLREDDGLAATSTGESQPLTKRLQFSESGNHVRPPAPVQSSQSENDLEEVSTGRTEAATRQLSDPQPSPSRRLVPVSLHPVQERPRTVPEPPAATGTTSTPTIHVTIGRVEVRAVMPPATPASRPKAATPSAPRLSLEEYLRSQNGGGRP